VGGLRLKSLAEMTDLKASSKRMLFEDNGLCAHVFGQHHVNLARIEQKLGVTIVARGNDVFIQGGNDDAVQTAGNILEALYKHLEAGNNIGKNEVDSFLAMYGVSTSDKAPPENAHSTKVKTDRRTVSARTANQQAYLRALERFDMVFALGPAGTGKTYLAVAAGIALLKQNKVERLILSRPAVEAGERLGFLPGDMREKVDPYLRPIYDALGDMLPDGRLQSRIDNGQIEIAPLAFMRGRTLHNAFVILDEAQNTTTAQMKMFLTRLGDDSRMVITGDPTQTDLPPGQRSGLIDAVEKLRRIDDIGMIEFDQADVVRHPLVARIIEAYDGSPISDKRRG
jgi:phosphate starvation-inducible PhoH-like protein